MSCELSYIRILYFTLLCVFRSFCDCVITAGLPLVMSPLPQCYRMYSIRYRSIPVRAVPVPVITAVISPKNTVTAVFPRITAVISSLAETSEPIDIAFGGQTRVCPNNHELDGGCRSPTGRSSYEGVGLYLGYLRRNQSTCRCSCNVDHPCPKVAGTHLQPLGRRTGGHPRPPTGGTRVGPGSHTRHQPEWVGLPAREAVCSCG